MSGILSSAGGNSGKLGETEIDYEEGEWAPVLASTGGGTWTLHAQSIGWYTKVGQLVTYGGMITVTGVSSESGNLNFTLPFTPGDSGGDGDYTFGSLYVASHGGDWGNDRINTFIYANSNANLYKTSGSGSGAYIDTGDVDGAFTIGFSGVYHTDV